MNPALAVAGVVLAVLFVSLIRQGIREGMEPQEDDELEQLVDENIRVWADKEREAHRIERMFRVP